MRVESPLVPLALSAFACALGACTPPEPSRGGQSHTALVRFVGRVDKSDPNAALFAWSGTGFVARFRGTELGLRLGGGQEFSVVVDGVVGPKYVPSGGFDAIAHGLTPGEHEVHVYRRTEAHLGESSFLGLEVGDGELLEPPPPPERRLELVGDSISCGYGNEGADQTCPFSPATENHYLSYGALTARALRAELSTVAWSGKGVVCNYGDAPDSCTDPLPTYYARTLPSRAQSRWDFSTWQPHAVIVNLGTNDFSTDRDPTRSDFEAAYVALLEQIRAAYADAVIVCTVGPMLFGDDLTIARDAIAGAVSARASAGDEKVRLFQLAVTDPANGYGCDWHPSLRTHQVMADTLTEVLRNELNWTD